MLAHKLRVSSCPVVHSFVCWESPTLRRQPQRARRYTKEEPLLSRPPSRKAEIRVQSDLPMIFHISKRIMLWRDVSDFPNPILTKRCQMRISQQPLSLFAQKLVHIPVDGLHSIAEKEDRVFDF